MKHVSRYRGVAVMGVVLSLAGSGTWAQSVEEAVEVARREAADLVNPGTPRHSATLRLALRKAGIRFQTEGGGLDLTRSLGGMPLLIQAAESSLLLDEDPRYRSWLQQQPVIRQPDPGGDPAAYRVIGGNGVHGRGVFDQVGVLVGHGNEQICSGVLMGDRRTVLTAAHCICETPVQVIFGNNVGGAQGARFDVLGVWNRGGPSASWRAPGTRCGTGEADRATLFGRDYGIVVLDEEVDRRIVTTTAMFPRAVDIDPVQEGRSFYVVGFGPRNAAEDDARIMPGVKNFAISPIVSTGCASSGEDQVRYGCRGEHEFVGQRFYRPTPGGPVWKVGPCRGDSGGAAILDLPVPVGGSTSMVYPTIGLVSRSAPGVGCGDAAVYTAIDDERLAEIGRARAELLAKLERAR